MSVQNHIKELARKHANLEAEITEEEKRPAPDNLKLTSLKRQKLEIKQVLEETELKAF